MKNTIIAILITALLFSFDEPKKITATVKCTESNIEHFTKQYNGWGYNLIQVIPIQSSTDGVFESIHYATTRNLTTVADYYLLIFTR